MTDTMIEVNKARYHEMRAFVRKVAALQWDGEELHTGETVSVTNDEYHDAMVDIISEARNLT